MTPPPTPSDPETVRHDGSDANDRALRNRLTALARADAGLEAPARVELALLRAWDEAHGVPARRLRRRVIAAFATAAALALGVALTRDRSPASLPGVPAAGSLALDVALPATEVQAPVGATPGPASGRAGAPRPMPAAAPHRTATAVVLVGAPIAPGEPVHLVRVRIPRDTLREMGLRPIASAGEGPVDVEMLVGEDGVARGLRVSM